MAHCSIHALRFPLRALVAGAAALLLLPVSGLMAATGVLHDSVIPNPSASVYFEYGLTDVYGNITESQELSGSLSIPVEASVSGLMGGTLYHYRLVADRNGLKTFGNDLTLTTLPEPPVAVTSNPVGVSDTGATLLGAVNPGGLAAQVRFIYGLTPLYGKVTEWRDIPAGSNLVNVLEPITGLIPGATYHYCIIATTAAGIRQGADVSFVATNGGAGTGLPTAVPGVTTDGTAAVGTNTAELLGTVNPHGGSTVVRFEYGMTTTYGHTTALQGVGNGDIPLAVSLPADGLLPGTHYHFRLLGSNSLGSAAGADAEFTTAAAAPTVVTGTANVLSTTSATVAGTVRARGLDAQVFIDYGTGPETLSNSITAAPAIVTGDATTTVSATLTGLVQGTTYYYQVRAVNAGGTARGNVLTFDVGVLSGLSHWFPDPIAAADRQGSVTVNLMPLNIGGGGWRFEGERGWRASGSAATGLTAGDRVIEYRRVPGYLPVSDETVTVTASAVPIVLARTYAVSGITGSGALTVTLLPASLTGAQWRFSGETDAQWKNSDVTVTGLVPGDYVIECKAMANRTTPQPATASVADGMTTLATMTYVMAENPGATPPGVLTFDIISNKQEMPYAYVGQITSDVGSGTGFVVRSRVVATAGHVVFDDTTLTATTGLRWYFQRQRGVHEPLAKTPRGSYLLSGYADQRAAENTPGTSSPLSQNLDAAALYFLEDAARGGYSGYFASDLTPNEFMVSSALKTLVGYPLDGIAQANQGCMHATPPANVAFASAYGQTYATPEIRSSGGNSGGPLCVRHASGVYYPAAIYLGGSLQMVVRAIDSAVVALFQSAEASAGSGVGITQSDSTVIATPDLGAIKVLIEPAAARAAGAVWSLEGQADNLASGAQIHDLVPNSYTVSFAGVPGFVTPSPLSVVLRGGRLTTLTFTYQASTAPPVITSPGSVEGIHGQPLGYQISATNSPAGYTLQGILPDGMVFHADSGLIDGTPQVAGIFTVTAGAFNAGGAGTRAVTFRCMPVLASQSVTVIVQQPVSYGIVSSETGAGVVYTAANLPSGFSLDGNTGVISGAAAVPGVIQVPITVARNGAIASAILTLNVIYPVPVFTLQPAAFKEVQYGMKTTLTAVAGISLTANTTLTYQWYEGASGDISRPVAGATAPTFTTPPVTMNTMYWVRAISDSCGTSANSTATDIIAVLSSANADLSNLTPSQGVLSPAFNPGILSYTVAVPYSTSISIKPEAQVALSTIMVNGFTVPSGSSSAPIPLTGDTTMIYLSVTAGDGQTTKEYTITVTRSLPPAMVTTGTASPVTEFAATLHGSVVPNGSVSAYFQYQGPVDTTYKVTPVQILPEGTTAVPVQATLSGLSDSGVYHYHLVVVSGTEVFNGSDMTFTINKMPVVATGTPIVVGTTGNNPPYKVTLVGAVNPMGLAIQVHFEYGSSPSLGSSTSTQNITSGSGLVDVVADISDLIPTATYFYRLVADGFTGGPIPGSTVSFQVTPGAGGVAPAAVTGAASDMTVSSVTLHGQVNPNGNSTSACFEYGLDMNYGSTTPREDKGNGSTMISVTQSAYGLLPGTIYHFRCVAENGNGRSTGLDHTFTTTAQPPLATTGTAEALTSTSVKVHATVRARGAPTMVGFEYATNAGFTDGVTVTAMESPVTGDLSTPVSAVLTGLDGGITYYFRVKASNPGGTVYGSGKTLQADSLLGFMQRFTPEVTANDYQGQVRVILEPSGGGWRFVGETEWRASGTMAVGLTTGDRQIEYQPLAGRIQPPGETVGVVSGDPTLVLYRFYYDAAFVGDLRVILKPDAIAGENVPEASRAQWRMRGDVRAGWRNSGDDVTGIWPGSYVVECKGIPGKTTPPPVTVMVQAGKTSIATLTYSDQGGNPPPVLDYLAGAAGIGNLSVLLQPDAAVANGARWRLAGDTRADWRNSGEDLTGILPGSYLVECKDVPGRSTPTPMKVTVRAGQTTTTRITYFAAMDTTVYLQPVSLATASTSQDLPYAYVGMLRSGTGGSYSGFVVKPQVVATVAQAVFDEVTLTATTDLQWLLQRNQDQFEPVPQIPRGFYAFTGYAEQRAVEGTPGSLAVESQNLNVAALYFNQAAGRGGFSGFLATAAPASNEFLQSSSHKTLVGYPLKGILAANAGQMHATPPVTDAFTLAYGQTYTTSNIQGAEGMLGGPLCVQYGGGTYYPAGIYVGGATGSAVRAIDGETVSLFASAALSGNSGANNTGGGITHSSFSTIGSPSDPGALKVTIEPAAARTAGAGWRLKPEVSYRSSGAQKNGLNAGNYILQLKTVSGFQEPAEATVAITGGQLLEVTYTYIENYTPQELWRLANFGTTSNTGDAADDADPDCDNCPNNHEYAAATDPNNAADRFRILTTLKDERGFTVTAPGKATRTYVLERCTNLGSGIWTEVDSVGPLGADGTVTLMDASPPENAGFYRARVSIP